MKAGLLYILFIFLILLAVSYNSSENSRYNNDIQTCSLIHSASVSTYTLPESVTSLKRILCGKILSDIFHGNLFESGNPDQIKMQVRTLMERNRPFNFLTLGQRALLFLICTKSSAEDHHLWNK